MEKYVIRDIYIDGYERFAELEIKDSDEYLIVHFIEYDEYLENAQKSKKKKIGDTITGDLCIDLVTVNKKCDKRIMHEQSIKKSSHIEAVIEVARVVDNYSIYAISSVADCEILVEFEEEINYIEGDRIRVEGSLEIIEYN